MKSVDLLVAGAGAAGLVAAHTGATIGADVLLAEKNRLGGDCLWTGCVPSKALLASSRAAHVSRSSGDLGVTSEDVQVDFPHVMRHVHEAIAAIEPHDSAETLQAAGVDVLHGEVQFTGTDTAMVAGELVRFRRCVVATGSVPRIPAIPGLSQGNFLTTDTVWQLTELPPRLVIIGGGSVGCELGQAFRRLGSAVTIIDAADRMLPGFSREVSDLIESRLSAEGVELRLGEPIQSVSAEARTLIVGGQETGWDQLLVAAGRQPADGIELAAAEVDTDASGYVAVSRTLATSNNRIWAAGDCTPLPHLTHVAGANGMTAALNALLGVRRKADPVIPRVTFTDPEVAQVGLPPSHDGLAEVRLDLADVDRAIVDLDTTGFVSLAVNQKGVIRGGTVVGPRAGEALAEVTLAVKKGLKVSQLAAVTHPYPTYGDAVWNTAIERVRADLATPTTQRLSRAALGLRRAVAMR